MSLEIDSEYKIGQDNIRPLGLDIHNPVFLFSAVTIILFVALSLIFHTKSAEFFAWLMPAITSTSDWSFISAGNIFVVFCLALIVTPLGKVRLGGDSARPDYSYIGWFAMLFAAGMGIGSMFFGVSEPMSHFASSFGGAVGDADAARNLAMAATIYHWGLHP